MAWPEQIPKTIAFQLAIAVAYALAYRVQSAMPLLAGTETASIIFIPALIRVAATALSGSLAVVGLFAGSLLVAVQSPIYEANALWFAFISAASAPLAYALFVQFGLLNRQPLREADPTMVILFIASYAVINAGLHILSWGVLHGGIASHFPFFVIMVVGDLVPPIAGFAAFRAIRWAFRLAGAHRH